MKPNSTIRRLLLAIRRFIRNYYTTLGILLGAIVFIITIIWYPEYQLRFLKFSNDLEYLQALNDTRITWAQILGGLGLVGTIYLTWLSYRLSQSGQIADRFAKAVELLGSNLKTKDEKEVPNLEARLGAIYALERIASDSPEDHWPAINLLLTYLRMNSIANLNTDELNDKKVGEKTAAREDVLAIASVIARRKSGRDEGWIRLSNTNLRWVSLEKANLVGAALWNSDLNMANLSKANLYEARLQDANLYQAELEDANLSNADLSHANLDRANLKGAKLAGATLTGASMRNTNLKDVDLSTVLGLTWDQLRSAKNYEQTKIPTYLTKKVSS